MSTSDTRVECPKCTFKHRLDADGTALVWCSCNAILHLTTEGAEVLVEEGSAAAFLQFLDDYPDANPAPF